MAATTFTTLTEEEVELLKLSLEASARRWNEWAGDLALPVVADSFRRQAQAASELALKLAQCDSVDLYGNLPSRRRA